MDLHYFSKMNTLTRAIAERKDEFTIGKNTFRIEYCDPYYRVLYRNYDANHQRYPIKGWRALMYGRIGHAPFLFVPPYLGDPSDFDTHKDNITWNGRKPTGDPEKDFYYNFYYPARLQPKDHIYCNAHRFDNLIPNNALWWEPGRIIGLIVDFNFPVGKTMNHDTGRINTMKGRVMSLPRYWTAIADDRFECCDPRPQSEEEEEEEEEESDFSFLTRFGSPDENEIPILDARLRFSFGTPVPDQFQHLSYTFYEEDPESTLSYPQFTRRHPMKNDISTLEYLESIDAADKFLQFLTTNHPQFACTDGSVFLPPKAIDVLMNNIVPGVSRFLVADAVWRKSETKRGKRYFQPRDMKILTGLLKFLNAAKPALSKYRKDNDPVKIEYVRYWAGKPEMGYIVGVRTPTDVLSYSTRDFKTVIVEDSKGRPVDTFRLRELSRHIDNAANRVEDEENIDL